MAFTFEPLDPDDGRAPYEQVAASIGGAIRAGRLGPGEKLPPHKELTDLYGFARATIQRALRELEGQGLIVSRKGSGVYVRTRPAEAPSVERLAADLRMEPELVRDLLVRHGFLPATHV